jgi:DNA repair protein RadD
VSEPFVLRHYQQSAVNAVYDFLRARNDNPCVVIPTGGGKTPVIAQLCKDVVTRWGGRVCVLAHVKELLEQSADKLARICPEIPVGIYSAGLGSRETKRPITVAGIHSIYKRACEFDPFDIVIVDEAHLIPPDGDGMYRQFLGEVNVINPSARIVGLTATPFRLSSGTICTPGGFLNEICYEVGVKQLIAEGYLCPLISKAGKAKADCSGLHVRNGEFVAEEVEALFGNQQLVNAAIDELLALTRDRRSVLLFASGINHGMQLAAAIESRGQSCHFLCGDTPDERRASLIASFRNRDFKYLCNVNVLTTGFDAPGVDCVALLRPTLSPGLYYQMVGRGFRLADGKPNCLVLDYAGNVLRHGPVDALKILPGGRKGSGDGEAAVKECPGCAVLINAGFKLCPSCGFDFKAAEELKHEAEASEESVLSTAVPQAHEVDRAFYSVHKKRGADDSAPRSMRVDYRISMREFKSEWICFEHSGKPRGKAVAWWKTRSRLPVPATAAEAVEIANAGGLAETLAITTHLKPGQRFEEIVSYELGEVPEVELEPLPSGPCAFNDEDVPF